MSKVTGPLFKWFGSKWLSSKKLPPPEFDTIIEPFAGSAGYSLRYCRERTVLLAETDPHILCLWSWLINDTTEALIREIPINVKVGTDIRTLGMCRGQELLLKTWQRTNNVGNCWTVSPWGNMPGQWTANTRSRVASEFHVVKDWKIYENGIELLYQQHLPDVTYFVDPPYQFNYQYKAKAIDYTKLAQCLRLKHGQVIVCEAVEPKTERVPTWLPFQPFGSRITSRRKADCHHHSKELLYQHTLAAKL